jgi:hypothetical protein
MCASHYCEANNFQESQRKLKNLLIETNIQTKESIIIVVIFEMHIYIELAI